MNSTSWNYMASKIIYSRQFLSKISPWKSALRDMIFEAAEHVALDPNHHDYSRTYLTPYKQKHPTTDHQYTLYFMPISANEIFFAWVNDSSCLHDTRNQLTDPCLKEFKRLLAKKEIEIYDPKYHQVVFEVHPDQSKPIRCRSFYLGHEITLNSYAIDAKSFIGHAFNCSEPIFDIALVHARDFLDQFHQVLSQKNLQYEIQFTKMGHAYEIDLLEQSFDNKKWALVHDLEDFILKKI